jgi:hypothetical protein
MNQILRAQRRRLALDRYLAEILVHGGLAELVPLKQRGRLPAIPAVAIAILSLLGWIGLPWRAVVLSLVLAFAAEALDYTWQRRGSGYAALVKRPLWARVRPPFYWWLAMSALFATWLYAGMPFFVGLLRGGFEWLCFRALEDMRRHPERYGSAVRFRNWMERLRQQQVHAFQAWVRYAVIGTLLVIVLNVSSARIWQAVGNTAWSRLLLFGGGLYVFTLVIYRSLAGSAVRSAVTGAIQEWEGVRPSDLKQMLRSVPAVPGLIYAGARPGELIEEQLQWKKQDNLVTRVGQQLNDTLVRRYQWEVSISSVLVLVLVALLIGASVFLIVPRDVVAQWTSPDALASPSPALLVDDLAELGSGGFWLRLLQLGGAGLAAEPLPKLAFLEAIIVVSLIMFETSAARLKADLDPAELRRWLALGTIYLAVLEDGFQYLGGGFVTRRLAEAGIPRFVTLRNDVLLVPAARQKASVFRAISSYLQVYDPVDAAYPSALTIFDAYFTAQEWIESFVRLAPVAMRRTPDLDRVADREGDSASTKYWIWSGNRLMALSNLNEARWYARLVPLYDYGKGEIAYDTP